MELTQDQKDAYFNVSIDIGSRVFDNKTKIRVINGYAGTGKTTLVPFITKDFASKFQEIIVMAPTNKAVTVVKNKLEQAGVECQFSTIHSFVYGKPNKNGYFVRKHETENNFLVIADEASMITKKLDEDLQKRLKNSYILYLGDDFQLEQVGEQSNIFNYPASYMNQVMRHDNGVLETATLLRKNKKPVVQINDDVYRINEGRVLKEVIRSFEDQKETIYITSTNKKRIEMNNLIRQNIGFSGDITTENLICINNNEHFSNGEIFKMVDPIKKGNFEISLPENNQIITGAIYEDLGMTIMYVENWDKPSLYTQQLEKLPKVEKYSLFGKENIEGIFISKAVIICTLGFAISAHKSQGSQFESVFIDFDFCANTWDPRRWLYTAITRATKEVNVLPSKYFDFI